MIVNVIQIFSTERLLRVALSFFFFNVAATTGIHTSPLVGSAGCEKEKGASGPEAALGARGGRGLPPPGRGGGCRCRCRPAGAAPAWRWPPCAVRLASRRSLVWYALPRISSPGDDAALYQAIGTTEQRPDPACGVDGNYTTISIDVQYYGK